MSKNASEKNGHRTVGRSSSSRIATAPRSSHGSSQIEIARVRDGSRRTWWTERERRLIVVDGEICEGPSLSAPLFFSSLDLRLPFVPAPSRGPFFASVTRSRSFRKVPNAHAMIVVIFLFFESGTSSFSLSRRLRKGTPKTVRRSPRPP